MNSDQLTKAATCLAFTNASRTLKVASSKRVARWEGKLVGDGVRLQWSSAQWLLEELPQKGKKKLRVATMQNPVYMFLSGIGGVINLLPRNILQDSGVGKSDNFDEIKKKLEKAMKAAAKADVEAKRLPEWVNSDRSGIAWYEKEVYFLEVVPENVEPFKAKGKDFLVDVSWTDFKAFSPDSDMQAPGDPHYTILRSKSKGAARKLFNTLKTDPNALKSVSWNDFTKWLSTKKIGYDYEFSQWH